MPPKTPTDIDRIVGLRVTTLRKAAGMTQAELGQALGVTFQQVQKYEKGMNRIGGSRLQTTAHALGVPVSALFDEADNQPQSEALSLLSEKGAHELLKAFVAIEDEQMRRSVPALVCTAARLGTGSVAESTKTKQRLRAQPRRMG